jgi:hypothetical protein
VLAQIREVDDRGRNERQHEAGKSPAAQDTIGLPDAADGARGTQPLQLNLQSGWSVT